LITFTVVEAVVDDHAVIIDRMAPAIGEGVGAKVVEGYDVVSVYGQCWI
jgi:hypothetical protein